MSKADDNSRIAVGTTPLAQLYDHEAAYWTTVATMERRDGWVLFHNWAFPGRYDPNHAGIFRAAEGAGDAIAREIIASYRARGLPPVAYVDALATPRDLADCLMRAGFREPHGEAWYEPSDLMLYVGPDNERSSSVPVVVAQDEREHAAWAGIIEEGLAPGMEALMVRLGRTEIADPHVNAYLALVDGQPAGRCLLFSGGGLARVEAVLTAAAYRRRGVAAAVVRQAVRDSLACGNRFTYLCAASGGEAQRLYTRLGFRTVAHNTGRVFVLNDGI